MRYCPSCHSGGPLDSVRGARDHPDRYAIVKTPLSLSPRRRILVAALAWLAMLGFDFLLHAGVLSRLYTQSSPFLLPPERAFTLIPLGYASFILLAISLVWLAPQLQIRSSSGGFIFGLRLGALVWGALVLGLASISTASSSLLLAWFIGQTLELGMAGAVVGSALGGMGTRALTVRVLVLVVAAFALTVALQSLGLAPAATVPSAFFYRTPLA